MEKITSPSNPLIKLIRSLRLRKHREETGLFVTEGLEYARKAMAHGFKPGLLLFNEGKTGSDGLQELLGECSRQGARIATVSPALTQRISSLSNPPGIVLACHARWRPPPIEPHQQQTILALHAIHDPGNLGTIMRTAEAAAVSRLLLIGDCCDPYAPEAVRASAGSIFATELSAMSEAEFIDLAHSWPGDVVGTHVKAAESFNQRYRYPALLVMGSESRGLPADLASACTRLVRIPMASGVESLNVAVATALMLYEMQLPALLQDGSLS